jgi:1,4-dihydroxy-2-naphthoate octaprenyltransferase
MRDDRDDDRGKTVTLITVFSAIMAVGGLLLTRVHVLALFGILLFILGFMGLVQAVAYALGIIKLHDKDRDRDR